MKNWNQFNEGLFLSSKDWEDKMSKFIENEGAISSTRWKDHWELLTKFGDLLISFNINDGHYTIFMMFAEPLKSKVVMGVNEHSGKWNIHESNMTELFRVFKMRIDEVKLSPEEKAANKYNL